MTGTAAVRRYALLSFLLLPATVYVAAHAGWFANYEDSYAGSRACGPGECSAGPGANDPPHRCRRPC